MANWQNLLKVDIRNPQFKELLDSLPPKARKEIESRMKDRDSSEDSVKYSLQVEGLLSDPKVESMRNELESMKEKMDDKASKLMRYMWDNDKNPVDSDDPEVDRFGPGFKASEILGKEINEIQREFGGYKPW